MGLRSRPLGFRPSGLLGLGSRPLGLRPSGLWGFKGLGSRPLGFRLLGLLGWGVLELGRLARALKASCGKAQHIQGMGREEGGTCRDERPTTRIGVLFYSSP